MSMAWTPGLAVGVKFVDEQHRELFRRAAAVADLAHGPVDAARVEELVRFLSAYVVQHFGAEETMMSMSRYPGADVHRREHADFVARLDQVRAGLAAGDPPALVAGRIAYLVGSWLSSHIGETDRALGVHLRRNGTAPR